MNPMPAGMEVIASAADLGKLAPFDPVKSPFGTQPQTADLVARALRDRALFVDTVFTRPASSSRRPPPPRP